MQKYEKIGLIAGRGSFPFLFIEEARKAGVKGIHVVALYGDTSEEITEVADSVDWVYVGQIRKTIKAFKKHGVEHVALCGQVKPGRLFKGMKPDLKAMFILAKLKERNAESLFGAVCDEFSKNGITVMSSVLYLQEHLATEGVMNKVKLNRARKNDYEFGKKIAKDVSRLDIGQSVVVKRGTVLAVEGFEGTDKCIKRGGLLGRGGVTVVKVSKPNQDMRIDVPCIGMRTVESLKEAGALTLAVEVGKTLFIDKEDVLKACDDLKICVVGI